MKKISVFLCLTVLFCSFLSPSVFASTLENYPEVPYFTTRENSVLVIYTDSANSTRALVIWPDDGEESPYFTLRSDGNNIAFSSHCKGTYMNYLLKQSPSSGEYRWSEVNSLSGTYDGGSYSINTATTGFIYSTDDIVDSDGNVVFRGALVTPTLAQVIQESLAEVEMKTTETMMIIALCGVGCLALLIGLVLLPKVLYKFL